MQITQSSLLTKVKRWPVGLALLILAAAAATKWQASQLPRDAKVPPPNTPAVSANQYFADAESLLKKSPDQSSATDTRLLSIVDTGLKFPYATTRWRVGDDADEQQQHLNEWLLASGIEKAGDSYVVEHDYDKAAKAYIDLLNVGADISNGDGLFYLDSGERFELGGRSGLYSVMKNISGDQADIIARRICEISASRRPLSQILAEDKYATQAQLLTAFHTDAWRDSIYVWIGSTRSKESDYVDRFNEGVESPRQAYESYTSYMDHWIQNADSPWPQLMNERITAPSDVAGDILTEYEQQLSFVGIAAAARWTAALDNLLATQLALEAFKSKTGSYPASLQELVPQYLPDVPVDPFRDGTALKYRTKSLDCKNYVLYSVGPDSIDNGGESIFSSLSSNGQSTTDVSSVMSRLYVDPANIPGDIVVTPTTHPTGKMSENSILDTYL